MRVSRALENFLLSFDIVGVQIKDCATIVVAKKSLRMEQGLEKGIVYFLTSVEPLIL